MVDTRRGAGRALEAVLFDLDGVVTDTAGQHYRAWKRLADELGIAFDRAANERLRGVSRRRSLELLLGKRRVSEQEMEALMARKNRYYQALIGDLGPEDTLPGARALLDALARRGVRLALASGSKNARDVLARLELVDAFELVADGHAVSAPKPAPDQFLYVAERLGAPPARCAVVEDAQAGVEAALAAGMLAVGVGPPERVGAAHLCYARVADVEVEALARTAARRAGEEDDATG